MFLSSDLLRLPFYLSAGVILAGVLLGERFFGFLFCLQPESYETTSPLAWTLTHHWRAWLLVALSLPPLLRWRSLTWSNLDQGRCLRVFVLMLATSIVWHLALMDYNYWFGEFYWADRIVMCALGIGLIFHPGFVPVFVLASVIFFGQLNFPVPVSWTHEIAPIACLVVFSTYILGVAYRIFAKVEVLVFALLVVIGGFYFLPGLGKLQENWLMEGELGNRIIAAQAQHGWMSFTSEGFRTGLAKAVRFLEDGFKFYALGLECVFLTVFFHRNWARILIAGAITLHIGVFALHGLLFLPWVIMCVATLFLLRGAKSLNIWNWKTATVGLFAIIGYAHLSPFTSQLGKRLSSRVVQGIVFELAGSNGETVQDLTALDFKPYDFGIGQANPIYPAIDHPLLVLVNGKPLKADAWAALSENVTAEQLPKLNEKYGLSRYDPEFSKQFDEFLIRWWRSRFERSIERRVLNGISQFGAPPHLWASRHSPSLRTDSFAEAQSIRIVLETWVVRDYSYLPIDREVIREIPLMR